jgi:tRNA U34 5-methylaminomethyl-2-thiouridine-forming methyltransferase MnmC
MARDALARTLSGQGSAVVIEDGIQLHLHSGHWREFQAPSLEVDAIYHDPFAPVVNPACWSVPCFEWEVGHLATNGRVVTYGAQGQMRRNMAMAGLFVASAPGPGKKREITFAAKNHESLAPAKVKYRPWLE